MTVQIVTIELHQFACDTCRDAGTLTTDISLAEGQAAEHERHYHATIQPEGEDA